MYKRMSSATIVATLLLSVLTACSQPASPAATPTPGTPATSSGKGDIKLAVLVSLTTDNALVGISQKNGTDMAIEDVNAAGGILGGRKVVAAVEDTANSNTAAVNAFNKVMSEKPVAIVGPVWGTQMLALEPLIKQAGIPVTTPTGTRKVTQLNDPWIFRFFPHDGISKAAQTKFAIQKLNAKKPAILYTADEYGQSGRDIIQETLKSLNITPVSVESAEATDKDLSTQLLKIKNAGADVIISQLQPANLAVAVKQINQLGISIPHVASNAITLPSALNLVTATEVKGTYVETAIVPAISQDAKVQAFNQKYQAKYGKAADSFATLCYDSTRMLLAAIDQAGSTDPAAITKVLRSMKYQGLVTTYDIDAEGNANHQDIIYRFKDNKELEQIQSVQVEYTK